MLRIFMTGMFISFLGTLPMGTLNISAMQISITDGIRPALLFTSGAILVEVVYVRLTLVAMGWFRQHKKLLKGMEWLTLVIILALAISSFYTAMHPSVRSNPILSNSVHRFWLGAGLSAVNPLQIPFWFGWSTVLSERNLLKREEGLYVPYITGIGFGTLVGHCIFIFGGKLLVDSLNTSQDIIQWVIGGIFLATAIIQLIRMLRQKDAISVMKEE
ncbi:MAG TPA: LysE family transporter [Chitinophagaceae bacterium]|nr:LysE family transporter [Chitinophagaceae bacterium]